jgi:hypothetical protein
MAVGCPQTNCRPLEPRHIRTKHYHRTGVGALIVSGADSTCIPAVQRTVAANVTGTLPLTADGAPHAHGRNRSFEGDRRNTPDWYFRTVTCTTWWKQPTLAPLLLGANPTWRGRSDGQTERWGTASTGRASRPARTRHCSNAPGALMVLLGPVARLVRARAGRRDHTGNHAGWVVSCNRPPEGIVPPPGGRRVAPRLAAAGPFRNQRHG